MKATRWVMVAIAAASAAGTAYLFQAERSTAAVSPAIQSSAPAERPAGNFIAALSELDRNAVAARVRDPFAISTSRPATTPAPLASAPARPPLPAFPYKYAGTLKKNGVMEAFLLRGADLVPIKAGDLLDGTWRIEALTADRVEVTFVPAGERMSMALANLVGEASAPAVASAGTMSGATYGQVNAGPAAVESAPARANVAASSSISGGFAPVPSTPAPAAAAPRAATNAPTAAAASTAAASSNGASAAPGIALGSPMPLSNTPLGSEAPTQGSMPLGAPSSGSFPKGETPTGKLGL